MQIPPSGNGRSQDTDDLNPHISGLKLANCLFRFFIIVYADDEPLINQLTAPLRNDTHDPTAGCHDLIVHGRNMTLVVHHFQGAFLTIHYYSRQLLV
jgi:hypothetical protein